jgi:hypothetical protein
MAMTLARGHRQPGPTARGPRTGGAHRARWRQLRGRRDEYWPLVGYFYLYPLWWVLGLAHLMLFIVAVPMLWQLLSVRKIKVPRGFALLAVFLAWMLLSITMLWVRAPSTVSNTGLTPLLGFAFRAAWYISIAITALYVLNASRDTLSARRVVRMLAYLFVITVIGGYAGIFLSNVDFPSLLELFLPHSITNQEFFNALLHPRLALQSDILGYLQPRITAPYSYPNTWGNAFGVLLPFFVLGWFGEGAGWRKYAGPVVLLASVVPAVNSLNRGLWIGLGVSFAWVVLREICAGRVRALLAAVVVAAIGVTVLASTSLGTTISLRIANPQSNERRQDTAMTVISTTAHNSPLLGFGSTRQMVGNFTSLAGGGTATCYQCAAPPLGTQGFLWGLIFMTGFVGAALFIGFLLWQVAINAVRAGPLALAVSTALIASLFYFFFYDSLDVPLLITFIALALADREFEPPADASVRGP